MREKSRPLLIVAAVSLAVCLTIQAQTPAAPSPSAQPEPAATFKSASRMVTVEVVAKDHQGRAVTGLKSDDFEVFEQIAGKHGKFPQKIATFQAVSVTDLARQDAGKVALPAGVFTNLVTMDKVPVPPTVLLLDGLNTDRTSQMQVHQQMVKMLNSLTRFRLPCFYSAAGWSKFRTSQLTSNC